MTEFTVVITPAAEKDITRSFLWGCEYWGDEMAIEWVNDLRTDIEEKLSRSPDRFALAPESESSDREFRQLLVGRYRVIFHVREKSIYVVHVRGPFSGESDTDMGIDE